MKKKLIKNKFGREKNLDCKDFVQKKFVAKKFWTEKNVD